MKNDDYYDTQQTILCINSALRILKCHDVSLYELRQKLAKRFDKKNCDKTIGFLIDQKYFNEEKSAYETGYSYIRKSSKGPRLIRTSLLNKNFPEKIVENVMTRLFSETSELELAQRCIRKKYKILKNKFANEQYAHKKITAYIRSYLGRNGFSQTIAETVSSRLLESELFDI